MKKITAILLLVVYITVISGVAFQLHYCGGKLASIKLAFGDNNHSCTCKSKKMKKGCCKTHSIYLKVKGDQKNANKASLSLKKELPITIVASNTKSNEAPSSTKSVIESYHAPPPRWGSLLLVFQGTFLI